MMRPSPQPDLIGPPPRFHELRDNLLGRVGDAGYCPHRCPRDVVPRLRRHQASGTAPARSAPLPGRGGGPETPPSGLITQRSQVPVSGGRRFPLVRARLGGHDSSGPPWRWRTRRARTARPTADSSAARADSGRSPCQRRLKRRACRPHIRPPPRQLLAHDGRASRRTNIRGACLTESRLTVGRRQQSLPRVRGTDPRPARTRPQPLPAARRGRHEPARASPGRGRAPSIHWTARRRRGRRAPPRQRQDLGQHAARGR
jgi:hypothetical protein